MRQLSIPVLQDVGYIFLWVTGRAMELGRECLTLWGYERIGELIWVKTNQLQRLIRTGRTGHWINHGKVVQTNFQFSQLIFLHLSTFMVLFQGFFSIC